MVGRILSIPVYDQMDEQKLNDFGKNLNYRSTVSYLSFLLLILYAEKI